MYSADMDKFAGAHCFDLHTIIESGIVTGLLEALPIVGIASFNSPVVCLLGSKDTLQADSNKKDENRNILSFVFDTILYLIYIT